MQLLKAFVRRYPFQTVFLTAALLLSAAANLIGLSSLLPALQILIPSSESTPHNQFAERVRDLLLSLGIAPTLYVLAGLILG
ncbi:MAG TPA: hypothetical protein VMJ74_00025, partial [Pseudomonadales bacterium]|nr:hypothetical protein [Pseudomonadales bacterium]